MFEFSGLHPLIELGVMFGVTPQQIEHLLSSEVVQEFLQSGETFDAVILEIFAIDAILGFGQHFNCPVIGLNTFDGVYWNDVFTGNQSPFSYVPMIYLGTTDKMTFKQRLLNTLYSQIEKLAYNFYLLPNHRKLYKKYFPNASKSLDEVRKNMSVLFTNSHISSSPARPLLPNMIGINGIHIESAKPLPRDIKAFLDSATDGVILFSMGSIVRSIDWSESQRVAFVRTFAKLKQKVIWKYENETLPGKPENVMIGSWIPQRDIIAHPNVRLFITHGGSLGTTEALSEGVPLLALPLYADQKMNMERAVSNGYALTLNYKNITEENFYEAVNEMLTNPIYDENAKRLSKLFNDRPMDPKQTVVYWTEHVIRQKGADYLKSAGNELNFIEFHLIDVYATLLAGAFFTLYITFKVNKMIFKKVMAKNQKQKIQ